MAKNEKKIEILYCGDSSAGGAARYLLCTLSDLKAEVTHVPPGTELSPAQVKAGLDVIILSDYSHDDLPASAEKKIVRSIENGAGLLMIGGWSSFTGISGHWAGTAVEGLLPVTCSETDDRLNFSGGAYISLKHSHPIVQPISFKNPPVICGANDIHPKDNMEVVLAAQKILIVGSNLALDPVEHPLLVVHADSGRRSAALATDLAPHWCGGLVDWGTPRRSLSCGREARIEVGQTYIDFIQAIIRWLAGREKL